VGMHSSPLIGNVRFEVPRVIDVQLSSKGDSSFESYYPNKLLFISPCVLYVILLLLIHNKEKIVRIRTSGTPCIILFCD
jgi:hypothetical protein